MQHGPVSHSPFSEETFLALTKLWEEVFVESQTLWLQWQEEYGTNTMQPAHEMMQAWMQFAQEKPEIFWKNYQEWFQSTLSLWGNISSQAAGEPLPEIFMPDPKDRRFQDGIWKAHPVFSLIKQAYFLSVQYTTNLLQASQDVLPEKQHARMQFYTQQWLNASAPTNFAATNPLVWKEITRTGGDNILQGMKQFLEDLRHSTQKDQGYYLPSTCDDAAFVLGKTVATTKGKVIFRNHLVEVIQYAPATSTVHAKPLLIVSPWINKYYILDLTPEKSLIKWLVERGYTVCVTSWVNPTAKHADVRFEDYMADGVLPAMEAVLHASKTKQLNVMGYCIGGTILACTLAWLSAASKGPGTVSIDHIRSATYITTLIDFGATGDLGSFVDVGLLDAFEERIAKKGVLPGKDMALVFRLLRANDLIWSFVVNNYLMGKQPFPFDILYWNNDVTDLPAKMYQEYITMFYQENALIQPQKITMKGKPLDIGNITTPSYFLAALEDHIVPWQSAYASSQYMKQAPCFVLTESGHVSGVVNPPAKKRYGYWEGSVAGEEAEQWFASAMHHEASSWWEHWDRWMVQNGHTGQSVKARQPVALRGAEHVDAPGLYVRSRA